MEILSFWILKLALMWIISTVECSTVIRSKRNLQDSGWKPVVDSPLNLNNAEVVDNNEGPLYITHMELENDKRARRESQFDRGYDEFLRNYHKDDRNGAERRGRYQVKESDESGSAESSSTSDSSDDDDGESESNESEEKRKKYTTKTKNKKAEQSAPKKKSKHCKTEKRGNMLCNICFDPKNDGKAESCSYNSDPKGKSYENSYDTSYSNRDGDKEHESLEDGDDEDESDESEVKKKPPPPPPTNKRPGNHRQPPPPPHGPRYYPPFLRPYPRQNYGPQTFLPQAFQPISVSSNGRRPIRIQIKNAPERLPPQPVALIRYRTVESPFGSQHIRLIMENSNFRYPSGPPPFAQNGPPQNHPNRQQQQQQQNYNRRPVPAAQEYRPPRDINGAHSESLLSNVTKEHEFEFVPSTAGQRSNREYAAFISKDWSRCEKSVENDQVCFECYVDGERRKECMFAALNQQPDNFYKSYSTSKKFSTNHPYSFDIPTPSVSKHTKHSEQKTKSHSARKNNKNKDDNNDNGDYSVEHFGGNGGSDERFSDFKSENYKNHANTTNDWDFNNDAKQELPQAQPLRSSALDVIYGKAKPGAEPLALFFATDPRTFINNSNSSSSNNNYKNDDGGDDDDDEHIETTTANINKHSNSNSNTKTNRIKNKNKTAPSSTTSRANIIRIKATKTPNSASKSI